MIKDIGMTMDTYTINTTASITIPKTLAFITRFPTIISNNHSFTTSTRRNQYLILVLSDLFEFSEIEEITDSEMIIFKK